MLKTLIVTGLSADEYRSKYNISEDIDIVYYKNGICGGGYDIVKISDFRYMTPDEYLDVFNNLNDSHLMRLQFNGKIIIT